MCPILAEYYCKILISHVCDNIKPCQGVKYVNKAVKRVER